MIAALIAAFLVFVCVAAPTRGGEPNRSAARLIDEVGITPQLGQRLPLELTFVDEAGQRARLGDFFGNRPVILQLVYYECPMLCKLSSAGLFRAAPSLSLALGDDYSIVTVSFDPREGPELSARARQAAMERCGEEPVAKGWRFLTGDVAPIRQLCEAIGFRYKFDPSTKQYAHAAGAFVVTADGRLSRFLSGVEFSPRDLRLALVEASEGKVGTAADQVLLMCYMYDPATGKYGLAIMTALRAAAIVTVASMTLGISYMLRRERRERAAGGDVVLSGLRS
jgi:protein SCO1/2